MRYRLLCSFFCFALAHTAQAQCNPKEYTKIFTEASELQAKGQFIEAKNRFEAAKIYACNQKGKDAVDARVDGLFEQIDRLRLQAYANDLAYKSNTALRDGDRNTAFRLAEFAYRYVDADNQLVLESMFRALYYNDYADTLHRLPRCFNLDGHSLATSVAFFNADQNIIAGVVDDLGKSMRKAVLWNLENRNRERTLNLGIKGEDNCWFRTILSPDGKWLAANCGKDNSMEIWNMATEKVVYASNELEGVVIDFVFSPNSRLLATDIGEGKIKVLKVENGETLAVFEGYGADINGLSFSWDGQRLAAVEENKVNIWDITSHQLITTVTNEQEQDKIDCVAFSPDGDRLAIGLRSKKCKIWDFSRSKFTTSLSIADIAKEMEVIKIAFSPDGKRLLVIGGVLFGADKSANIWDIASGKIALRLEGHMNFIADANFSGDGRYLSTCSLDGAIKIWDLTSAPTTIQFPTEPYVSCMAFSPNWNKGQTGGKFLAMGHKEHTVDVWDLARNQLSTKLECQDAEIRDLVYSPDGNSLAILMADSVAEIWDLKSSVLLRTIKGVMPYRNNLSFSPDGKRICLSMLEKVVKIWDIANANVVATIERPGQEINNAILSPDGMQLAMVLEDTKVEVWDLVKQKTTLSFVDTASIFTIAFSPTGQSLAIGLNDNTAKIWDISKGKMMNLLSGHTAHVRSVNFSPDGRYLMTGTTGRFLEDDQSSKVWDLQTGKAVLTLEGNEDNVSSALFAPDGQQIATLSNGEVKLWEFSGNGLINRWNSTGPKAELVLAQLQKYNLENLLDQQAANETQLIATAEVAQMVAFAELASAQASGSNLLAQVEPLYARADRLYAAALALKDDPKVRMDYAKMLRSWAEVCKSDGLESRAAELNAKADALWKGE